MMDTQQMCKDQLPVEEKGAEMVGFRAIAVDRILYNSCRITRMKSLACFASDWVWREKDKGQLE